MVDANSWIAVYILAGRRNGTLYTGVTSRLDGRVRPLVRCGFRGVGPDCP
jgi:hypothetical protein